MTTGKRNLKLSVMALTALATLVFGLLPDRADLAQAQGALCNTVETSSPYFQQYCLNSGNYNDYSGYTPYYNSYNNTAYGYNYGNSYGYQNSYPYQNNNYTSFSGTGYSATCSVVETSSPYFQQYCRGYGSGYNYNNPSYGYFQPAGNYLAHNNYQPYYPNYNNGMPYGYNYGYYSDYYSRHQATYYDHYSTQRRYLKHQNSYNYNHP